MTDEELNQCFAQIADAIDPLAEVSTTGMQRLEEGQAQRTRQLEVAHLRAMEEIGLTASILRQSIERDNQYRAAQAQTQAASNDRMDRFEEGLDRLEMLIENRLWERRDPPS
ncbi:MAG: hypothetical protein NW237_04520 [Cyanobacteriota bacterium]|nr:hypothetical protein [Cyanobacteriota bacterium]